MAGKVVNFIRQGETLRALWEAANILEHDAKCWKHIMERSDPTSYEGVFAQGRMTTLQKDVDRIYEAILDKQKEQQQAEMRKPFKVREHPANNWDYSKRIHRKGYGRKESQRLVDRK